MIKQFNKIQEEILEIGWIGVLKKYHPDNNCNHPMAFEVFDSYKSIYDSMLERIIIYHKEDERKE